MNIDVVRVLATEASITREADGFVLASGARVLLEDGVVGVDLVTGQAAASGPRWVAG